MVSAVQTSGMRNVLVLAVFPCYQLGARGGMRVCAEDLSHTSAEIVSSEVELVSYRVSFSSYTLLRIAAYTQQMAKS